MFECQNKQGNGRSSRVIAVAVIVAIARPTSPDLARPHLVGVAGRGWVWLGTAVCGCGFRSVASFSPEEHQDNLSYTKLQERGPTSP